MASKPLSFPEEKRRCGIGLTHDGNIYEFAPVKSAHNRHKRTIYWYAQYLFFRKKKEKTAQKFNRLAGPMWSQQKRSDCEPSHYIIATVRCALVATVMLCMPIVYLKVPFFRMAYGSVLQLSTVCCELIQYFRVVSAVTASWIWAIFLLRDDRSCLHAIYYARGIY